MSLRRLGVCEDSIASYVAPSSYMSLEKMQHWPHLPHMPHSHPGNLILEVLERAARTGDLCKSRASVRMYVSSNPCYSSHDDEVRAYIQCRLLLRGWYPWQQ